MTYRQRIRLAWELTWPLAVLDLFVVVLIYGFLGVESDAEGQTFESVWAVVVFFVVSPWVIRRAFQGRILTIRKNGPGPIRYQESLKVMWLLAWRTMILALVAILLLSGLLRLIGLGEGRLAVDSPMVNSLGLSAVDAVTSLLFTPLLVPAMLRKKYRGFHLQLAP